MSLVHVPRDPDAFLESLSGPTFFHVVGRCRARTRVAFTLLHGNEPSGLRALHAFLLGDDLPAVNLLAFVGAVDAARAEPRFSNRMLPGHRDLNRCFCAPFEGAEGENARAAIAAVRAAPAVEAVIDLHNNSGHSPPYGIGTTADASKLGLASLFGRRFILTDLRLGSAMEAFADLGGVTIECGRAGDPAADDVARAGLRAFACSVRLPAVTPQSGAMALYAHPLRVALAPGARVAFAERPSEHADLTLNHDVDRHNYTRLDAGTRIGWVADHSTWPIVTLGADARDASRELFALDGRALVTARPLVPVMMTTNSRVAAEDCLFYVVRPVDGQIQPM